MICTNCGKEIKDGSRFCLFCGTPQASAVNTPQASASGVQTPAAPALKPMIVPEETGTIPASAPTKEQLLDMMTGADEEDIRDQGTSAQSKAGYSQAPYSQQAYFQQAYPQQNYPQQNYSQQGYQRGNDAQAGERAAAHKKKPNIVLPIVLCVISVLLIAAIVVLVLMILGKIDTGFLSGKKEDSYVSRDYDEDEEDEEDESSDKRGSSENDDSSSRKDQDDEDGPQAQEEENITLSCGAVISSGAYVVDLTEYEVDSLEGLEKVTNLDTLIVDGGSLTDVSPLSGLTRLRTIALNNVPVADLTPLIDLPMLENLTFLDTEVDETEAQAFHEARPEVMLGCYAYSEYVVVNSKVSWTDAKAAAESMGGHLAVITTSTEMDDAVHALNQAGLTYVWLGGYCENGQWYWVTGETFSYTNWWGDEPSGADQDGTIEDKLCIWNIDGTWTENDQRNDLQTVVTGNSLGYLVEFEYLTGKNPLNR